MVHRINTLHSRHATLLEQCNPADTAHTAATSAGPPLPSTLPLDAPQALAAARCAAVEQALDAAAAGMQRAAEAGRALGQMEGEVNPHEDNAARFDQLVRGVDCVSSVPKGDDAQLYTLCWCPHFLYMC